MIRAARDEDALDVIELIGGVFGEYPGCVLDVDGEMPKLRAIATWARSRGGSFWVAEEDGRVVACCGYTSAQPHGPSPTPGHGVELRKLYVHRRARKLGHGAQLLEKVLAAARAEEATYVDLWSDTRFETAHRFYERRGFVRGPTPRALGDKSATVELYFRLDLAPSDPPRPPDR